MARLTVTNTKGIEVRQPASVGFTASPGCVSTAGTAPQGPRVSWARSSGLWNSIALRFGGFSATIEAMVSPLEQLTGPRIASTFFSEKLPEISELARKNPSAAHRIIETRANKSHPLWRNLVLVACGDGNAMAPAMDAIEEVGQSEMRHLSRCLVAVAEQRPKEGRHLMHHAFHHSDIDGQIGLLRSLLDSDSSDSTRLVGELFVKMMERSNSVEREKKIYPELIQLVSEHSRVRSPQCGFLTALLRGWLSERPREEVSGINFNGLPGFPS